MFVEIRRLFVAKSPVHWALTNILLGGIFATVYLDEYPVYPHTPWSQRYIVVKAYAYPLGFVFRLCAHVRPYPGLLDNHLTSILP